VRRACPAAGGRGEACSQRQHQWRTGGEECTCGRAGLPFIGMRARGEECGHCLGARGGELRGSVRCARRTMVPRGIFSGRVLETMMAPWALGRPVGGLRHLGEDGGTPAAVWRNAPARA
jgi:hypothetical protein